MFIVLPPQITWYGTAHVEASVPYVGNPYDPFENDIKVELRAPNGYKVVRPCYYMGDGKYAAEVVTDKPGVFNVRFLRNGTLAATLGTPTSISTKLAHGFIGISGKRFAWTDGTPYFPIGYDYGWRNGAKGETVAEGITEMGTNGANWSRIWACHWDGKNPFFPSDKTVKLPGRELFQAPLQLWDDIVDAAEKADVHFQFVLFHHGPYSSATDSNWAEHPWNAKNGGFMKTPVDFFTTEEAKRRTKIWLYNAVARYSQSPGIMAWELFNEVQWVDAMKTNVPAVAAWHNEMVAYIKSIDPYHHPVTSSSMMDHPEVFAKMDYLQPHTYPSNLIAAISAEKGDSRPLFFGEFGPPAGNPNQRQAVRDGIYAGILAGHAGAGMYWYWDQIKRIGLLPDYNTARHVIAESGLLKHPEAIPLGLSVDTPTKSALVLSAGAGWEKSAQLKFDLPLRDASVLGKWSPYFQSLDGANKKWAAPLEINFETKQSGFIEMSVGQVSSTGGDLTVYVNGEKVKFSTFPGGAPNSRTQVSIPIPAGTVHLRAENHGPDWIRIDRISIPGLGATAFAHGIGSKNWALVRIFGSDTSQVKVTGLGLDPANYLATVYDLDSGATSKLSFRVLDGTLSATDLPKDCVIALSGPFRN